MCVFFAILYVCVSQQLCSACIRGWGIFFCLCVCFCNFAAIVSIVLAVFCSGLFTFILGNKFAYLNVEKKTLINLFFETNVFACLIFFLT